MKKFRIKRGKHSAKGIHFNFTFKKNVTFKCKFNKSCLYYFDDNDKYDINKLCGFSTTWFHQRQSGRIGWRCLDGERIEIVTYSYNDGTREQTETDILGIVLPDQEFIVSIEDNEDMYIYTFENLSVDNSYVKAVDKKQKDWFFFHYLLFPYFGGNKTAPHDMTLYVKKIS